MGEVKSESEPGQSCTSTIVLATTDNEQQSDNNESVQYFYEIMKAEDQQNQVLLEEEITVEDDNGNNSELNRLNALSDELKQIIVKHNLSIDAANDIVMALNNYGINLPQNSLQLNNIEKTLSDIQTDIRDIKNYIFYTQNEYVVNLPIVGGLDELNEKLAKEPAFVHYFKKIVRIYKPAKGKCPNTYGLSRTFSDDILAQYNWDGSHGRKNFQNFKHINRVLFDAWGGDETFESFSNYTKSIRNQFTTARVRRHKRTVAAKAKNID